MDTNVTFKVNGMHCRKCEERVLRLLTALPGVSDAAASFSDGRVEVAYDRYTCSEAKLRSTIEDAGYKVENS